jgi:hypothetical protein
VYIQEDFPSENDYETSPSHSYGYHSNDSPAQKAALNGSITKLQQNGTARKNVTIVANGGKSANGKVEDGNYNLHSRNGAVHAKEN